ncbi:MAG TPA: GGDEF domain-containing protein, partial [Bacilli bacterium]|nr:GGDEF domain-containing protein [Bacilli bacterium]
FGRAVRLSLPIAVLMADIDFFKSVNDTYGHLVGDRVLIQIAQLAKKAVREGDIVIRYGGEEFMAILPGASQTDARQIAERLRRTVEETVIHHGGQEIKVTISIGINSFPENDVTNVNELIDAADKALYKAKETGRNKVV